MIAVLAEAGARVGNLERNDDGALGSPVEGTLTDDAERLPQRNLAHSVAMLPDDLGSRKQTDGRKLSGINDFRAPLICHARSTSLSARSPRVWTVQPDSGLSLIHISEPTRLGMIS